MKSKFHRKEHIWALIFIGLPVLGFLIFTLAPMFVSVWYSLTDFNPIRDETNFVGLKNFYTLFKDKYFIQAIFNTIFLLLSTFIGMILGLLLAEALKKQSKINKAVRLIYYLPAVSSVVAISIVWRYLFNGEFGFINKLFGLNVEWLGTGKWPIKFAIIIKNIWASLGATMILYIAGLNNISDSYYEAAQIDGANKVEQFWHITVPLIQPIRFYIIITGIIGGLQAFADVQLMANGNPEAITIVYYIWSKGIDANRYGIASAASIILAVAIMIVTIIQFRKSDILDIK